MAKFRRNYAQQSSAGSGMIVKVGIFTALLGGLFFIFNMFSGGDVGTVLDEWTREKDIDQIEEVKSTIADDMLPSSATGIVVKHEYYALSYSEQHEQPEWVVYELTRERLNHNIAQRSNDFRPDPKIPTGSSDKEDFRGSGYDRGHLVPAADMSFSQRSMSSTFYMSNISPQVRNFNGGIWRELEENTRDWARRFRHLYIVTGPVLSGRIRDYIGENEVAVPDQFFKVILDISEPELKGIAYLLPNNVSFKPIDDYATSIDEVEALTGIDFFPHLLSDEQEALLESQADPNLWRYSEKRYKQRLENWNKR